MKEKEDNNGGRRAEAQAGVIRSMSQQEALHLKKLTEATCQEMGLETADRDGSRGSLKSLILRVPRRPCLMLMGK